MSFIQQEVFLIYFSLPYNSSVLKIPSVYTAYSASLKVHLDLYANGTLMIGILIKMKQKFLFIYIFIAFFFLFCTKKKICHLIFFTIKPGPEIVHLQREGGCFLTQEVSVMFKCAFVKTSWQKVHERASCPTRGFQKEQTERVVVQICLEEIPKWPNFLLPSTFNFHPHLIIPQTGEQAYKTQT